MEKQIFSFLFIILALNRRANASRVFDTEGGEQTILAIEDEDVNVECKSHTSMSYCGFIHPTGKRFSFSGNELNAGHCAIKIKASKSDHGVWRCHIGSNEIGVETNKKITVKVVSEVAAVRQNITVLHGKPVTLYCATARTMLPMSYCRFEPPNGNPFSINSEVTSKKPILGRYYFPKNKSLDRGDCAVTIRKVKYEDVGRWVCGAGLEDGKEHTDVITLEVEGLYTLSTASMTGITLGTIGGVILLVILAVVTWRKRRLLGSLGQEPGVMEAHELGSIGPSQSRRGSPERSPTLQRSREIPSLVVQSPSEPGSSPA